MNSSKMLTISKSYASMLKYSVITQIEMKASCMIYSELLH